MVFAFETFQGCTGRNADRTLTAWQKFRECQIYGWIYQETGRRRFRKAFTEVGRKNAKSQMEAGEALFELAITSTQNNEVNEIYTAGVKREQSKIVFNECDLMTRGSLIDRSLISSGIVLSISKQGLL